MSSANSNTTATATATATTSSPKPSYASVLSASGSTATSATASATAAFPPLTISIISVEMAPIAPSSAIAIPESKTDLILDPLIGKRKSEDHWGNVIEAGKTSERFHEPYSIVYRGNSIDGWIAAFLAYKGLMRPRLIFLHAVSATREVTKEQVEAWKGHHVLLLDLTLSKEAQKELMEGGVLSLRCLDHRESSVADWEEGVIQTDLSTAYQTWQLFYRDQPAPFWLDAVNRISLWRDPLWEDRCLREVLMPLAHMPEWDAVQATKKLMIWMTTPACIQFQGLMKQAEERLVKKDKELLDFLQSRGRTHTIMMDDAKAWKLTADWVGTRIFLLENSERVIDTNEAAHLVFQYAPDLQVFVNLRKRRCTYKGKRNQLIYVYSARSTGFDLTSSGFFAGQKQSAGAQAYASEKRFVVASSSAFS